MPTSPRGSSMGVPLSNALPPEAGLSSPLNTLMSVDLPQPDGPSTDTNSPAPSCSDRLSTAVIGPLLVR